MSKVMLAVLLAQGAFRSQAEQQASYRYYRLNIDKASWAPHGYFCVENFAFFDEFGATPASQCAAPPCCNATTSFNNEASFKCNRAFKQALAWTTTTTTATTVQPTDEDWTYFRITDCLTWPEAKVRCNQGGGQLVVIPSSAKNELVKKFLFEFSDWGTCPTGGAYPWIGGDCTNRNACKWVDGTPWSYQPFGIDDDYVHYYTHGAWGTWCASCKSKSICERGPNARDPSAAAVPSPPPIPSSSYASSQSTGTLMFDFGAAVNIFSYQLEGCTRTNKESPLYYANGDGRLDGFKFEASEDGLAWTTLSTVEERDMTMAGEKKRTFLLWTTTTTTVTAPETLIGSGDNNPDRAKKPDSANNDTMYVMVHRRRVTGFESKSKEAIVSNQAAQITTNLAVVVIGSVRVFW